MFPCVLTRYSFYCDIVICGAIWAAAAPVYGAALSEDTLYSFTLVTDAWVHIQEDEFAAFLTFKHNFGGFPYFFDYENERICNKLFANGPPDPTTHYCTPHILQLHKVKCKIFQGLCKCVQCI